MWWRTLGQLAIAADPTNETVAMPELHLFTVHMLLRLCDRLLVIGAIDDLDILESAEWVDEVKAVLRHGNTFLLL
jgi:hypothetical protein